MKECTNISHISTHTHVYSVVYTSNYVEEDGWCSHCMWSKCMYIMQIRCMNQKWLLVHLVITGTVGLHVLGSNSDLSPTRILS